MWYAVLLGLCAVSLVPAALVFPRSWSAGVPFGRPLLLLLWAEGTWLVSALTPIPYGQRTVVGGALAIIALSVILAITRPEVLPRLRARWRVLLAHELLFAAVFASLILVRAQTPAAFGNEKPMEILLLTAVHHAGSMPPEDPWFAGEPVAYYHLGYVGIDLLARSSAVSIGVAFNLALATAGAMAATAVAGVAGDLAARGDSRRAAPWVAAGAALVSFLLVAPLQGALDVAWNHGLGSESTWARLGVAGFPGSADTVGFEPKPEWWWWHASRVVPDTITEFPAFSFLLGDLHPHVLALPVGLLALALAARTTVSAEDGPSTRVGALFWRRHPVLLPVAGAVFAGLYMTNAWDVVPYGLVWAGAALLVASTPALTRAVTRWRALVAALVHVALPAGVAAVLAVPFARHTSAPLSGLGLVAHGSDPVRFGLVWVPLVLPVIGAVLLWRPRGDRRVFLFGLAVALIAVGAWVAAATLGGSRWAIEQRGSGWGVIAGLTAVGAGCAAAAVRAQRDGTLPRAAALGLVALSCALVLGTELTYVAEAFHFDTRINTVFKLWYAVWVFLAIAGAVGLADAIWHPRPGWTPGALAVLASVYLLSLAYVPFAVRSRVEEPQEPGLDALAFHRRFDPDLAAARRWVEANLGADDLLLEAVGDQFTYTGVLSATTRARTLLGWLQHELIWRGRVPGVSQRWAIVHATYLDGATEDTRRVAEAYGVTHVYLGRHEVDVYGPEVIERFAAWPVVFESGATRIVRVPEKGWEGDGAAVTPP